ncbi:hypothetical protein AB0L40_21725 [Patulibacter sp. NPDC049589]|uniref:hypothetical protein n=1 Tax=Patulibacter sp. NPDC049589 TaxID=3154731 RepID=UPI003414A26E
MKRLISAELLRLRYTRAAVALLLLGAVFLVISDVGFAQQAGDGKWATDEEAVLALVRNGFSLCLFAALFGAVAVSGELQSGDGARAWLARPSWRELLGAKATVAAVVGLVFGLVGAGVATLCAALLLPGQGVTFAVSGTVAGAIVGVVAVNVLAALWGTALGALLPRTTIAVAVVVLQMLLLEPGLVTLASTPFDLLFGNALGAIYGETGYDTLPLGAGIVVAIAWIAAAAAVAVGVRRRSDVPMGGAA